MDVITMRSLSLLIILVIIIGSFPAVAGKAVENPTQRDEFLYDYFSHVLTKFEYSLKYALENENYSLTLANATFQELELLQEESMYYQDRGLNLTVMRVIPPFYEFSKQLILLDQLTLQFQNNPNPKLAAGILGTVKGMESLLDAIDPIKLRDGTKILTFNTEGVRRRLEEVKNLALKVPPVGEFTLGVSERTPILNETVTIFGTCPENRTVTIVVTNGSSTVFLAIKPKGGFFSIGYRFESLGAYRIYATQSGRKSNTVNVTVRKIPTLFIVSDTYSAFLEGTIKLKGKLVDYYGQPLAGRNITIGDKTLITGSEGEFSKEYFSDRAESLRVALAFAGDRLHGGTSKEVTLIFKKYPVSITLNGPDEANPGEKVRFKGTIDPPLGAPLTVYVNDTPSFTVVPSNGTFAFNLTPERAGRLKVYVVFPGSETHERAMSNAVSLTVVPPESAAVRYLSILILALILMGIFTLEKKRAESKGPAKQIPPLQVDRSGYQIEEHVHVPEDVGEAYKLLREKLHEAFGIDESMTPREVLKTLKGWGLYPVLERVTLLHEKAVYGETSLSEEELREFHRGVKRLLGGVTG
ncbi:Ig-like domain repeat protein [Thermococcus sp. 21S7]|uniref:Ig-like domain repeat protein n=1 Tax=Thermococcus sp. 21S7 TaxID=1638221 RepID=UPI00143930B6|nr:Ig-like domain repeat protein [Thermococcus sp. 21S7]NJE62127.1 Ig-like domain repeat protein [Thermococcus sp. 21S7]